MKVYEPFLINHEIAKILLSKNSNDNHLKIESYIEYKGPLDLFRMSLEMIDDKVKLVHKDHMKVEVDGLLKREYGSRFLQLCQHTNVTNESSDTSMPTHFKALIPEHLSDQEVESKTLVEFRSLLECLVEQKLHTILDSEYHVASFLIESAKFAPHFFKEDYLFINDTERAIIYYCGRFGHFVFENILGRRDKLPDDTVNLESEIELEKEINGKLWFSLDGLVKHWSKYGLTKEELLHYAELGKLELCYDWLYSQKIRGNYSFEYYPHVKKSVSPLIKFEKKSIEYDCVHPFHLSDKQESNLFRFAAISKHDVSELIANGFAANPTFTANGFQLLSSSVVHFKLTESDLRVTAREIRLFEENMLGLKINRVNKSKTYSSEKTITPAQEHSHLRVIGALLKTIEERATKPFTLEVLKFELEEKYSKEMGIKGFSKSSLDTLFANANKALRDK